jgi:hypothetical protein
MPLDLHQAYGGFIKNRRLDNGRGIDALYGITLDRFHVVACFPRELNDRANVNQNIVNEGLFQNSI